MYLDSRISHDMVLDSTCVGVDERHLCQGRGGCTYIVCNTTLQLLFSAGKGTSKGYLFLGGCTGKLERGTLAR